MDRFTQDIRFAIRTLRRSPGFTAAVVVTIALGIGANTSIFTVLDGVVLRPLPFPDSDRVVSLCETHPRLGDYCVASPPNVHDWGQMSTTLATVGVARTWTYALSDEEGTVNISAGIATPGYLTTHLLTPAVGRLLQEGDLIEGSNRVVVLGYGLWQSRFGGDPDVVGTEMVLDGQPFTIVGALPADAWIRGYGGEQMWTPLTASPENTDQRDWRGFTALARLAEGATIEHAREELAGVRLALEEEYPEANRGWGIEVVRLRDRVAGNARPVLMLFLGAVAFVLLIGCANVANLMLVRATERTQEFAVRASLGAGRKRIIRQLLTESVLLSVIGGLGGFGLAIVATRAFLALAPENIPRLGEVGIDTRALGFALLLSAGTAVAFGLAPAWKAARTDLNEVLKASRHGDARSRGLRGVLVVSEIALALMLLIGAGLLTRSFSTLLDWDPGFDRDNLIMSWGLANTSQFKGGDPINAMFDSAAREIAAIPGVTAVGQASAGPLFGGRETDTFVIEGRPELSPEERPTLRWYDINPDYFAAMRIPLLRGRAFTEADNSSSLPVAIINETMARQHWPEEDPIGERVSIHDRSVQIVGIVRDVHPFEPDASTGPEIYWPRWQAPRGATFFIIRTELEPAVLERQVKERLKPLDGQLQLMRFITLEERTERQLVSPRFNMALVGIFATVAMVLAAIGIYGVIAYAVANRTHEIGVRIAVGARPGRVMADVIRSGMRLAITGMVVGVAGALALGRFLSHLLYGIPASDPPTYLGVCAVFLLVTLVACIVPARRASRLDPVQALRTE